MSIFGRIMNKIFHHGQSEAAPAPQPGASNIGAGGTATMTAPTTTQPVDVGAVLGKLAAQKGGGGNYETSIVDLLKLLDMDSSLDARKELANELNVHVGADGSAEENIALHKAVMDKIAQNGGVVPANLRH